MIKIALPESCPSGIIGLANRSVRGKDWSKEICMNKVSRDLINRMCSEMRCQDKYLLSALDPLRNGEFLTYSNGQETCIF